MNFIVLLFICIWEPFPMRTYASEGVLLKNNESGGRLMNWLKVMSRHSIAPRSLRHLDTMIRILGGQTARPNSYPSAVSIRINQGKGFKHACGGVILTERIVLTAAHCIFFMDNYHYEKEDLEIVAGEHDVRNRNGKEQWRSVRRIVINDDWMKIDNKFRLLGDVSLIVLDIPLIFNDMVKPVLLSDFEVEPTSECVVVGWGSTKDLIRHPSRYLQELVVEVVNLDDCRKSYKDKIQILGGISSSMICAGNEYNKDSCSGDSGGPLYCLDQKNKVFLGGVVSWGHNSCGSGKPGIYTRVRDYIRWIKDKSEPFIISKGIQPVIKMPKDNLNVLNNSKPTKKDKPLEESPPSKTNMYDNDDGDEEDLFYEE